MMEKKYNFYRGSIQSSDGKTRLEGCFYAPAEAAPRAVIQISHGMTEYIGRYEALAAELCPLGYIVCGHDALGHGHSAKTKEDFGFFAPKRGAEILTEDLYRFTCLIRQNFENLPVVLLGFSMGSFIARRYMARYPKGADAYVICGTAGPEAPAGLGKAVAKLLCVFGKRRRSKLLCDLAFAKYMRGFPRGSSSYVWLSDDEEYVKSCQEDTLCGFMFTVGAYYDLFDLLGFVSRRDWAGKVKKDVPVLLLSGCQDPVGNFGKGVEKVYRRLLKAGLTDVQMRLYPGARHDLFNGECRQPTCDDLIAWLRQHNL